MMDAGHEHTDPALWAVLDALPMGLAVVGANGRLLKHNPAFTALLPIPFGHPVSLADIEASCDAASAAGREIAIEGRDLPDGTRLIWTILRPATGTRPIESGPVAAPAPHRDTAAAHAVTAHPVASASVGSPSLGSPSLGPPSLGSPSLGPPSVGLAVFCDRDTLQLCNPGFAAALGLPETAVQPGTSLGALLTVLAGTFSFACASGTAFLAAERQADRRSAMVSRHTDRAARAFEFTSDPMAQGGWVWRVTAAGGSVAATGDDMTGAEACGGTQACRSVAEEAARSGAQAAMTPERRAEILESVLGTVPHGVCVYDADNRVTLFNPAYEQIMAGAKLQIGEHLNDIIRRRAREGEYGDGDVDAIIARQEQFDDSPPNSVQRRRPNGTVIDVRTAPLPDGGHISVVTDITALTRAEAEISRHAQDMDLMLRTMRHGILYWGPDRRLIASNEMAGELLGHPPGLLVPGRSTDELLDHMIARNEWGDAETTRRLVETHRGRDRSIPYRRFLTTRAGRVLDARSDPAPGGGWISTFSDVTESVKAEEELRRAKEAAEAASQAKSRFLATMSHELRTPLNAVIGFSDALLREGRQPAPARVTEFAQQINDAGRQLLGLINMILDVARIESGRFNLSADRVDIRNLVLEALRTADPAAQAAEINLEYELPDELPVLRADERRLQQVLGHLLSNAVKFTDAGGTVTVGAAVEPDSGLRLYVRDTGIGIPAADLERVFEPFTQLDSTLSRRFQGAGIGLYVARALVIGHGGQLTLASRVGEGTVAKVMLPGSQLA
jgi:signal transduction histidine kinase